MRDDAKLSHKVKAQIRHFAEGVCVGLTRAVSRAISEVLFGLCKGGDVKLTCIGRCLKEKTSLKKIVERISRNLSRKDFSRRLNRRLVEGSASRVEADTLLVMDESDIQKRYARSMEHLGRVRDGSEGKIGQGYSCVDIVATEVDGNDVIPLWGQLYSVRSGTCGGENAEVTWAIRDVSERLSGRGVWVMDRGFDRGRLIKELLRLKQRFIVRLRGRRHLMRRLRKVSASELRVPMRFAAEVTKVKNGRKRRKRVEFGQAMVRLPFSDERFRLVKVRFKGSMGAMLLLTNVQIEPTIEGLLWVVKAYLARWRVEESIRQVKQSYNLEDVRLRSYNGLRNMTALVTACANFVACHVGLRTKLQILARKLLDASQRVGNIIKNFKYYALTDGLKAILQSSSAPWRERKPPPSPQLPILFPASRGLSQI
nr:hypothetical protein [Bacillota bacterium]